MEQLLHQFQTRRAALLAPTGKRPGRYPDELRNIAIAYSKEAQAQGMPHRLAAETLGVDPATLAAWQRQKKAKAQSSPALDAPPKLRRVEVVDSSDFSVATGGLCVVGPRGLRIEGMSIEQVVVLFERLAC